MASAVLPSLGNEPSCWKGGGGDGNAYMRQYPTTTTTNSNNNNTATTSANYNNTLFNAVPTTNPNPNSTKPAFNNPVTEDSSLSKKWKSTVPEDSSSVKKRKSSETGSRAGHVKFNLDACGKRELKELKKRLLSELEQVRVLKTLIGNTNFESRPVNPPSPPPPPLDNRLPPPPEASAPVVPDGSTITPKGNNKKAAGVKRANPFSKSGQNSQKVGRPATATTGNVVMRKCGVMLSKLMKHKHGWVFNTPVDYVALRLFDYLQVIKNPMDLGTVKSKLEMGAYKTPVDFANDVRLTFLNALIYNPKDHEVHFMAKTLLAMFDEMFNPIAENMGDLPKKQQKEVNADQTQNQDLVQKPVLERETTAGKKEPMKEAAAPVAAKEKKREMSFEEKQILGRKLIEVPLEKSGKLMSILKKRGGGNDICYDGDDIEFDIELLDNETLWELDKFVKSLSEVVKKKEEKKPVDSQAVSGSGSDAAVAQIEKKVCTEKEVVDEDVDIGDESPVKNYPAVEIEKDDDESSSSSGSSSGGSSSSSGSDSGSDSDAYSVQSPYAAAAK